MNGYSRGRRRRRRAISESPSDNQGGWQSDHERRSRSTEVRGRGGRRHRSDIDEARHPRRSTSFSPEARSLSPEARSNGVWSPVEPYDPERPVSNPPRVRLVPNKESSSSSRRREPSASAFSRRRDTSVSTASTSLRSRVDALSSRQVSKCVPPFPDPPPWCWLVWDRREDVDHLRCILCSKDVQDVWETMTKVKNLETYEGMHGLYLPGSNSKEHAGRMKKFHEFQKSVQEARAAFHPGHPGKDPPALSAPEPPQLPALKQKWLAWELWDNEPCVKCKWCDKWVTDCARDAKHEDWDLYAGSHGWPSPQNSKEHRKNLDTSTGGGRLRLPGCPAIADMPGSFKTLASDALWPPPTPSASSSSAQPPLLALTDTSQDERLKKAVEELVKQRLEELEEKKVIKDEEDGSKEDEKRNKSRSRRHRRRHRSRNRSKTTTEKPEDEESGHNEKEHHKEKKRDSSKKKKKAKKKKKRKSSSSSSSSPSDNEAADKGKKTSQNKDGKDAGSQSGRPETAANDGKTDALLERLDALLGTNIGDPSGDEGSSKEGREVKLESTVDDDLAEESGEAKTDFEKYFGDAPAPAPGTDKAGPQVVLISEVESGEEDGEDSNSDSEEEGSSPEAARKRRAAAAAVLSSKSTATTTAAEASSSGEGNGTMQVKEELFQTTSKRARGR